MITSLSEIKALLSITTTSQDDLINRNIPIIEDDIRVYCNNGFANDRVYIQTGDVTFTRNSTSADVITYDGTGEGFIDANFKAGYTVQVQNSYNNDGFFDIETVSSTVMTLYSSTARPYFDNLVTEDEAAYVQINQVLYPRALDNTVVKMVQSKLVVATVDDNVKSETVSRYRVEFAGAEMASNGYPKKTMSALNKWRNVVFK